MFDLENITGPEFLKTLTEKELEILAKEIRNFLIEKVSKTGGHLASNLGIVEITIALHYVFDSPEDKFLFDVGHQSYVHKILTGRAKEFNSLRKIDGLSGYISRTESPHDCFESGHSSTSISTQIGMIFAEESKRRVVSIIGDSSIANGIAFEGMNFAGGYKSKNPIIILNDNKMGISKSVGSFSQILSRIRGTRPWRGFKAGLHRIFPTIVTNSFHRIKRGLKGFLQRDNIFEDLGFDYFGPYDGNNIHQVIRALEKVKSMNTPCILHLITKKGKGYEPAEKDDLGLFHGVDAFDPESGMSNKKSGISFSEVASLSLLTLKKSVDFKVI